VEAVDEDADANGGPLSSFSDDGVAVGALVSPRRAGIPSTIPAAERAVPGARRGWRRDRRAATLSF
jgi:hypothetical protein